MNTTEEFIQKRKLFIVEKLQKKLGKNSYAILTGNKGQNTVLNVFNLKKSEISLLENKSDVDIFSERDIFPSTNIDNFSQSGANKYINWFKKYQNELNQCLLRDEQFFVLKNEITHYS